MRDENGPMTTAERDELLAAGLKEAICVIAGVLVFAATSNWLWIVIGILAGSGFSLPAVIRFVRARRQADHAAR